MSDEIGLFEAIHTLGPAVGAKHLTVGQDSNETQK